MSDQRLNVWHLAILTAVLTLSYRKGKCTVITVSRRKMMVLSHINTKPTYHKYFKQLQLFGYINYLPSFNPDCKSQVELNEKRLS